jgi:hypothetical protein
VAKLPKPVLFTKHFKVDPKKWDSLGLFDPSLNVDTPLFIDPLLLSASANPTIRDDANEAYIAHFKKVIKFLPHASKETNNAAWKAAKQLLTFPEIRGTCLGYGAGSTRGAAFGRKKTAQVLKTAKEIVDLGIQDPDLFVAMSLFEDKIGPDLISDMTTNVIISALTKLNETVAATLKLPTSQFNIGPLSRKLIPNPYNPKTPILLVPKDILRDLPIAKNWDDIQNAITTSTDLREAVNSRVARIWADAAHQKDKDKLRQEILHSKVHFEAYLAGLKAVPKTGYNVTSDPKGVLFWKEYFEGLTHREPLKIPNPSKLNAESMRVVVEQIIEQFAHLIENRDLWRELWHGAKPRPEKAAQRLFFAVAFSYCEANNLDISPETDTGRGPVDFKFSSGSALRHLVEIKLSSNGKLVHGYTEQLSLYTKGEKSFSATYIVLNVGKEGKKFEQLDKAYAQAQALKHPASKIVYIDGMPKKSASKA